MSLVYVGLLDVASSECLSRYAGDTSVEWRGIYVSKPLIALSATLMLAVACQYTDFNDLDEKCFEPVYFLLTQTAKIDFAEKHRLHLWF